MGNPVGSQFLFGTLHLEKQDYLSDVPLLPDIFFVNGKQPGFPFISWTNFTMRCIMSSALIACRVLISISSLLYRVITHLVLPSTFMGQSA